MPDAVRSSVLKWKLDFQFSSAFQGIVLLTRSLLSDVGWTDAGLARTLDLAKAILSDALQRVRTISLGVMLKEEKQREK